MRLKLYTTKGLLVKQRIANLLPWLMLTLLTIAIFVAAQTEKTHYDCAYDDQVMTSTGQCIDLDSIYDAAKDNE